MHFCVSAARVSLPGMAPAHLETSGTRWPRKIGTNWFIPALVNSRLGESRSAFLRVSGAGVAAGDGTRPFGNVRHALAKEDRHELVHPRVSEQQVGRIRHQAR